MSSKKPTLIAYTIKERGDGQKAIWTRSARLTARQRDRLHAPARHPSLDGRIVLTEPKDRRRGCSISATFTPAQLIENGRRQAAVTCCGRDQLLAVIKLLTLARAATSLLTALDTDGDTAFGRSNLQRSLASRPALTWRLDGQIAAHQLHPSLTEDRNSSIRTRRRDVEACVIDRRMLNRVHGVPPCPRRSGTVGRALASLTSTVPGPQRPCRQTDRRALAAAQFRCAAPAIPPVDGCSSQASMHRASLHNKSTGSQHQEADRSNRPAREAKEAAGRGEEAARKQGSHPMHLWCDSQQGASPYRVFRKGFATKDRVRRHPRDSKPA